MLREAPDVLEADLQRHHGIDLAEFYRGELSLRRLSVLVQYLPADSATARLANDGEAPWQVEHYLLSHVYTALTGKPHPGIPKAPAMAAKTSRASNARARLEAQRARLASR